MPSKRSQELFITSDNDFNTRKLKIENDLLRSLANGNRLKLVPGGVEDLAHRIAAQSSHGLSYGGYADSLDYAQAIKDEGTAPHLFGNGQSAPADKAFGGHTPEQIEKMTPFEKIAYANEMNRPKGI